jgi:hypothetical protein
MYAFLLFSRFLFLLFFCIFSFKQQPETAFGKEFALLNIIEEIIFILILFFISFCFACFFMLLLHHTSSSSSSSVYSADSAYFIYIHYSCCYSYSYSLLLLLFVTTLLHLAVISNATYQLLYQTTPSKHYPYCYFTAFLHLRLNSALEISLFTFRFLSRLYFSSDINETFAFLLLLNE